MSTSPRFAILILLIGAAAGAQTSRTAVSINGSDTNPCTVASPCRSFGAAIAQTLPGGEVIALDSGGYGTFTITQAVTVAGAPGVHAALTSTGATGAWAIEINATPADTVTLRNLVVIGTAGGALGGIYTGTGVSAAVHISGCVIRGFADCGICLDSPYADIDRTSTLDNAGITGIGMQFINGKVRVTNSMSDNNTVGVSAEDYSRVDVANTSLSSNGTGAQTTVHGVALADLTLDPCTISDNGTGVSALGGGLATIRLSNNVIAYNTTGVSGSMNATLYSYHNNDIDGNDTNLAGGTTLTALTQR